MNNRLIAVVDGVVGIREGYSNTSVKFFRTFVEAYQHFDDLREAYINHGYAVQSETKTEQVFENVTDPDDVYRTSIFVTGVLSEDPKSSEWFVFNQLSGLPEETLPTDLWWENGSAVALRNWSVCDVLTSIQEDMLIQNTSDLQELEYKITDMRNGFPIMNDMRSDILHYFPIVR